MASVGSAFFFSRFSFLIYELFLLPHDSIMDRAVEGRRYGRAMMISLDARV
jgi:hypothetical protein